MNEKEHWQSTYMLLQCTLYICISAGSDVLPFVHLPEMCGGGSFLSNNNMSHLESIPALIVETVWAN